MFIFRHLFILVGFILVSTSSSAQLIECTKPSFNVMGWLPDSNHQLSIEQVDQLGTYQWNTDLSEIPLFTSDAIWLKMQISHLPTLDCRTWLTLGDPRLASQRVYQHSQGEWIELRAGSDYPLADWPALSRQPRFPIFENHYNDYIYARIESPSRLVFQPILQSDLEYYAWKQSTSIQYGALLGLIALLIPLALVMAWFYKSLLILFNTLSLCAYFSITFIVNGYLFYFPSLLPFSREWVALISPLSFIFFYAFVYVLFDVRKMPLFVRATLLSYIVIGGAILAWGIFGDFFASRQLYVPFRHLSYFIYPLLLITALFKRMKLNPLAWFLGTVITYRGINLLISILQQEPVVFRDNSFSIASNLLLAILLISTLLMTLYYHRKNENWLKRQLSIVENAAKTTLKQTVELRTNQLKQSLDSRNYLLAKVSHDLRSPLGQIIDYAKDIRESAEPSCATKAFHIERSAKRQLELLDDLIVLSRGQLLKQELIVESGYLYAFLHEIEEEGKLLATRKNNRFIMQLQKDLPSLVQADFKQLRRVLINIMDNAAKHTEDGVIELDLRCKHIKDSQYRFDFSITDTGCGLSNEEFEILVQPFKQQNSQTSGFGLGLAIVSELLEQMNSQLNYSRTTNDGSCFMFSLVLNSATEDEIDNVYIDSRVEPEFAEQHRILLVDDTEQTLDYLEELLLGYGFDIAIAADGNEALQQLRLAHYDLVITDMMMPNKNGIELLQEVKRQYPSTPVLLYSAMPPLEQTAESFVNFDETLLKPATSKELLSTIFALCRLHKRND